MMMFLNKRTIAIALAGALTLAGCGKPQTETPPGATEPVAPAAADAQQPPPTVAEPAALRGATNDVSTAVPAAAEVQQPPTPAESAAPVVATGDTLTAASEFATKSLASPFVSADAALKESFDSALIANQIGDYARAVRELEALANTPDLTSEQKQAVQDLLTEALKKASDLAATNTTPAAATQKAQTPPEFPLATTETALPSQNLRESLFSTADPAVKRSFARANAAFNIGNYDSALAELQDLATNSQLNWQQKYAVQSLLDKTPQSVPAAPAQAPGQTPKR